MALSRAKKEEVAEGYAEGMGASPHAYLVNYEGIKVNQVTELRRRIRESGGQYSVVKNRIALRSIGGTALEGVAEHFTGMTAVAYCANDPVALAKVLTDFAKEVPALDFKAGIVEGQAVAGDEIKAIANLPSREELIAKLLYLLQSPISRFVRGLGAIPQQFVSVLEQIRQQKQ